MPRVPPLPAALLATLLVAACSGGPAPTTVASTGEPSAPGASDAPAASATPNPATDRIDHPTGPDDIVLRAGTQGGFVRLESVMARVPEFTLYGDGRVLLAPEGVDALGGDEAVVPPVRETHLSEDEVQALLRFALVDGRLGSASDEYLGGNMDAPSTVFELHADGVDRRILVTGLTDEPEPGPDAVTLRALSGLVARLRSIPTDADYASDGVVAVLAEIEPQPGAELGDWPFADLLPRDFPQPADEAAIPLPTKVLTADEAAEARAALGELPVVTHVTGPDARDYTLVLRPALPDELAAPS